MLVWRGGGVGEGKQGQTNSPEEHLFCLNGKKTNNKAPKTTPSPHHSDVSFYPIT